MFVWIVSKYNDFSYFARREKKLAAACGSTVAYTFYFFFFSIQQFQYKVTTYPLSAMWNSS